MNKTSIEWTHRPETGGAAGGFTWNPIRAVQIDHEVNPARRSGTFCTRISPGCTHCYASSINKRFGNGLEYTVPNLEKVEFFIDEKILAEPLRRKKPATIFVGDMFDLFHEAIPGELIWRVLIECRNETRHTFQILTKRTERMREMMSFAAVFAQPNIWLGTSVESQKYADERIPLLLQTPAAVRFLSVEPMLEAVDLENLPSASGIGRYLNCLSNAGADPGAIIPSKIDWVICGGESGPGARPFNLAWAESLQEQCKAAGVAFFMKQAGSAPTWDPECGIKTQEFLCTDSKGGDPSEWPEHLRVRQFPAERTVTA
jgi:protein gp37